MLYAVFDSYRFLAQSRPVIMLPVPRPALERGAADGQALVPADLYQGRPYRGAGPG